MDEFDAFAQPQTTEEDPAAEFLAREQSEMAGLEDFESFEAVPSQEADFGLMGEEQAPPTTGEFDQLEDAGEAGFSQPEEQETNGPTDMYSAISQHDTVRAEPEKIRLWREEHTRRLQEKDDAEEKEKEEWRQKAKKELDDWYKHHSEQLQKTQDNNRIENEKIMKERAAEEAFIKDRDEKVAGQAWEKITRLCEFNPKNSKTTKDVSRMRSILLQLKQTPLVR